MKGGINKAAGSLQGLLEFEWQTRTCVVGCRPLPVVRRGPGDAVSGGKGGRHIGGRGVQCLPAMVVVVIARGGGWHGGWLSSW